MPESSKPRIIAGIPAYNEEKYIGTVVLNTRQYVDEVVVVDDGSSDDTSEVARLAGADVIRHPHNRGYGAAIKRILSEARKRDPDILVILDADAQHNPKEIPEMLVPIKDGFDLVIGSREQQSAGIPMYRKIGQRIILRSVNVLSKERLTDSECGFRAFSRKAIASLRPKEDGMAVSAETVAEAARRNLKVTQVPVSVQYTRDGSTLHPIAHGLSIITRVLVWISERKPLFFFGLGGALLIALGLVAGVFTFSLYSKSGVVSIAWTLVSIFFITIGSFSFFTGLILRSISGIIHSALSKNNN